MIGDNNQTHKKNSHLFLITSSFFKYEKYTLQTEGRTNIIMSPLKLQTTLLTFTVEMVCHFLQVT